VGRVATVFRKRNSPQRRAHPRAFTLTELLFVGAIGAIVLGLALALLVWPSRSWGEAIANFYLDFYVRLTRERIVRGVENKYGLRSASLSTIQIQPGRTTQVEWVDFDVDDNDNPTIETNDDVRCRVIVNPGLGLSARTTPGSGTPESLLPSGIQVQTFNVTQHGRVIHVDLGLKTTWGGRTYTRTDHFDVYIRND